MACSVNQIAGVQKKEYNYFKNLLLITFRGFMKKAILFLLCVVAVVHGAEKPMPQDLNEGELHRKIEDLLKMDDAKLENMSDKDRQDVAATIDAYLNTSNKTKGIEKSGSVDPVDAAKDFLHKAQKKKSEEDSCTIL